MFDWTQRSMVDFTNLRMNSWEFNVIIQKSHIALKWGALEFIAHLRD